MFFCLLVCFFKKPKVRVAWHPVFAGLLHTLCKVWRCDTHPGETKSGVIVACLHRPVCSVCYRF